MKAIIEIPKGDNRRRHIKPDKSGFVDLGPIKNIIPINDGVMPIHYGYIPKTLNEQEGDEIDVLVLSDCELRAGQKIEVEPIALIKREDKDDKIVAVDQSKKALRKWSAIPKSERDLIEDFFSYHHKFLSIEDAKIAELYVEKSYQQFLRQRPKI
jgi:inorganic pyrophosphatase